MLYECVFYQMNELIPSALNAPNKEQTRDSNQSLDLLLMSEFISAIEPLKNLIKRVLVVQ